MVFNFFGFKKRPDIQDVEPKEEVIPPQVVVELVAEPEPEPLPEPAHEVASAPEESSPPEPDQFIATREDVIAAFKIFLGRLPESEEVIGTWVGVKPQAILVDFLKSQEFLNHAQKSQFILALAKKVLDDRRQADAQAEAESAKAASSES
jgi:hypothetical protein